MENNIISQSEYFENLSNYCNYYIVPKVIFDYTLYSEEQLSSKARIAYLMMVDRLKLSLQNNWSDEEGVAFIYFSRKELCDVMGIAKETAKTIFRQLIENNLIIEKCESVGLKSKVYVCTPLTIEGANF